MPQLISHVRRRAPKMPLIIQESYTSALAEMLRHGEIDVIILSLPYSHPGVITHAVYDEPFRVVVPAKHPWATKARVPTAGLCREN
jgi:LysR family hydrogen peroxide-inducible transcriptional activator